LSVSVECALYGAMRRGAMFMQHVSYGVMPLRARKSAVLAGVGTVAAARSINASKAQARGRLRRRGRGGRRHMRERWSAAALVR